MGSSNAPRRLGLPTALLLAAASVGMSASAATLVPAGTVISASPSVWSLDLPGGYVSVNLGSATEIACPSSAGCLVEVDVSGSAQDLSGVANQVAFGGIVDNDGNQEFHFSYASSALLANFDSTAASVSQTITVSKGKHWIQVSAYAPSVAQLNNYQVVYRVFKK